MTKNFLELHSLQNLTTEFELVKNLQREPLEIIEIDERSLSFHAPHKICGSGLIVHMEGRLQIGQLPNEFMATGRVVHSLEIDESQSKYTVELHRYDKGLWDNFRNAMQENQNYVDQLFQSMRDKDE